MQLQQNILQHKLNTKKTNTSLVASYNLQPGNGMGLFGKSR